MSSTTLLWAGLGLLALAGLWQLLVAFQDGLSGGRDFVQDYAAIVKIGLGRDPYEPYNDVTEALFGGPAHKGPLYSFHAPSALPLLIWMLPIARVAGYTGTFLSWGLVSMLALVLVCWATLSRLGAPRPWLAAGLSAFALIVLPPIRANFDEGQLNVAVAAGMVGCWAAQRSGRPILAGILLGVAFALKPIPGLFFLYYLWRREWPLLGAAIATTGILSVIGLGLSGFEGAWLWATVNYPSHASVWPGYPDNGSIRGFFTRIFGPSDWRPRPPLPVPYVAMVLWAVSGAALTLLAAGAARAAGAATLAGVPGEKATEGRRQYGHGGVLVRDLEIAVLTVLSLLVTPIVWPHYYVVLVMPIAVAAVALVRIVLDGGNSPMDQQTEASAAPLDRRRRLVPGLALVLLGVGTAVLSTAHYVEPYAGNGGQQLSALLCVFVATLVALWWTGRAQRAGVSPADSR